MHPSNTLAQKNATKKTIAVPHGPLISHTIGPPKVTSKRWSAAAPPDPGSQMPSSKDREHQEREEPTTTDAILNE